LLTQRVDEGLRNQFGTRTVQEVVSGERDELMNILTTDLNTVAAGELGIEVLDVRVKKIELPTEGK
jgi:membrane protease subunit HflC